jgi:aspartate-semialdehyde dehydrogenase
MRLYPAGSPNGEHSERIDTMGFNVAVVGATGNVGRELLDILAERAFPGGRGRGARLAASEGREVSFGTARLKIRALEDHDFSRRTSA